MGVYIVAGVFLSIYFFNLVAHAIQHPSLNTPQERFSNAIVMIACGLYSLGIIYLAIN